ncbi:hypothetical protein HHK36_018977 [Tetracentron sinense]|uniref:Protein kinase domain-containing protein n=1 Tax=Tetracentron sinense TaxID=13715 RepID=A0A835D958_TETSI|nr:hypothetical protein HHK36_018977 [Tetracentron sinense]
MGWFPCSGKSNKKENKKKPDDQIRPIPDKLKVNPLLDIKEEVSKDGGSDHIAAQIFTFRDLAAATKNFRADCLLGEGGFGRVYKGRLEKINQIVAIKQLDHLPADKKRLDWNTRMKIAAGAAKGLEYLHDKVNPPARPLFKDRRKFSQMADPILQGQYPVRGLYQALAVAAMCLQEQPTMRPLIADVVTALTYLASQTYGPDNRRIQSSCTAPSTPRTKRDNDK